jgi:hypothetical protein
MFRTFLKTTLFIIFFFTFINKVNAQFKILDDLKKTGEQILKEQEQDKTKEKSTKPATSAPATPPAKTQQDTKPAPSAPVKPPEKPTQAIKQSPFSKSFRMMCTYSGNNKVQQYTYAVEGKNFIFNGFNIELGVETGGMLAIRQGSSNTVKLVINQQQSGIVINTMVDFDKLKADHQVAPLNVTLIGICQKL